ncbi:MAG: hypothetical protein JOZ07_14615 [Solirubrobacterales bacterium]|nr:hypothetical protein [Solirubrobacterales bacterium]
MGRVRLPAAALLLVVAGVHFQQYVDFMSLVPTVGVLFLLNAAGGAGLAAALLGADRGLRRLAALGGLAVCVGSLVSIAIALAGSFFGYHEPSLRLPIVIAIAAEVLALPALGGVLVGARSASAEPEGPSLPGAA